MGEIWNTCMLDHIACMSQPSQLPETQDSFKTERLQEAAQLNSPQVSDTFSHSKWLSLISWWPEAPQGRNFKAQMKLKPMCRIDVLYIYNFFCFVLLLLLFVTCFGFICFLWVFKIYFLSQVFGQEISENPCQLSYTDVYVSEKIPLCLMGPKESIFLARK